MSVEAKGLAAKGVAVNPSAIWLAKTIGRSYIPGMKLDWSQCQDVESVPGRVSGQWVVRGTRILADALVENTEDGYSAQELTELFQGLEVGQVERILAFARGHVAHPA